MTIYFFLQTITIKSVQELMNGVGRQYRYTKENIIKSEARVYQTLNFNVRTSIRIF